MKLESEEIEAIASAVASRIADQAGFSSGKRLLTLKQAAEYIGRSAPAVRALIAAGAFPSVVHDRRVFVDRADLDAWIKRSKGSKA
jgi:excisionase family DNA binding protein